MGLLDWFRSRRSVADEKPAASPAPVAAVAAKPADDWEELPAYLDVDPSEHPQASVIATAIAAGDRPDSTFVVRRVSVRNPEFTKVALIASALAAGAMETSEFVVRRIYKKKTA